METPPSPPIIRGSWEDGALDAFSDEYRAGYLWFVPKDDRSVLFSDIKVFDEAILSYSRLRKLFGLPQRTFSFQGQGIGNALMTRFISLADEHVIKRVYGSITSDDFAKSPFLPDMYSSRGFKILQPDEECTGNAAYKIELNLPIKQSAL